MPTLDQLQVGQCGRLTAIHGDPALVQRFYEMGLLEGETVQVIGFAPMGDPMEILVCNYRLSLRKCEARGITVDPL